MIKDLNAAGEGMRRAGAVLAYCLVLAAMVAATWFAASAVDEQRATVQAAETMLAALEGRSSKTSPHGDTSFAGAPAGSPFIEGATVNVAGATLLQRVGGAVARAGGNVLSSQVDLQRADAKDGWIGLVVVCEFDQASVQSFLYDLEAGMPFLFIDQLALQAPVVGVAESRARVLLTVSGQWIGRR